MKYHLMLDTNTMTKPWRRQFDGAASNWELYEADAEKEHWTCDVQDEPRFREIARADVHVQECKADG